MKAAITAVNAHIARLDGIATSLDACGNQLANLDRTSEIQDIQLAGLAEAVGDCRNQLANLTRQTTAIMAGLPRPPATHWLALSIVGVLALGIAAGISLSDASLLGKVVSLARTSITN